jgi:hypothetical protein
MVRCVVGNVCLGLVCGPVLLFFEHTTAGVPFAPLCDASSKYIPPGGPKRDHACNITSVPTLWYALLPTYIPNSASIPLICCTGSTNFATTKFLIVHGLIRPISTPDLHTRSRHISCGGQAYSYVLSDRATPNRSATSWIQIPLQSINSPANYSRSPTANPSSSQTSHPQS